MPRRAYSRENAIWAASTIVAKGDAAHAKVLRENVNPPSLLDMAAKDCFVREISHDNHLAHLVRTALKKLAEDGRF